MQQLVNQIIELDGARLHKNKSKECPYSGQYEFDTGAEHQCRVSTDAEHDYDEPYFEPASEFDALLEQLKELGVAGIQEQSLRLVLNSIHWPKLQCVAHPCQHFLKANRYISSLRLCLKG